MILPTLDSLLHVGMVIGIHGLRGDLKIRPLSGETTGLIGVNHIWLTRPGGASPAAYTVERASWHKGNLLVHLDKIADATSAQTLVGCEVMITDSDLVELDDDEYYWFELEGLRVTDRQLGELGSIVDIFTTPAHDIYVVQGARGEILIPAVAAFILEVDLDGQTMRVDLPEGLVPESQGDAL